ncbi:MAG: hypothetical protein SF187_23715 [Deltaproteobacteria bacterium]|nr:hypothetical protein [Deltaproteobacteria bacterium]
MSNRRKEWREFVVVVGRTEAGSVRLKFVPKPPQRAFDGNYRQLAIAIYKVAIACEQLCHDVDLNFVISPETFNNRLDIEASGRVSDALAQEFVEKAMLRAGLENVVIE